MRVFVALACPDCPSAVVSAHQLALENDYIRAEMIDGLAFSELAQKFEVTEVPTIIINGSRFLPGAGRLTTILEAIEETTGTAAD